MTEAPTTTSAGAALRERARTVRLPSRSAEYEARRRLTRLLVPATELGEAAGVAVWWAGVTRACPAPPPVAPHAMVLAADHGIAERGVSARPLGWTADAVAQLGRPDGPLGAAAAALGVSLDVVDVDVAGPAGPTGRAFDSGPALDPGTVDAGYERGMALTGAAADHDVLVLSCVGVGSSTTAAALLASALGLRPHTAVSRGSGVDDLAWMRKVAALRDGLRRSRLAGVTASSPALDHLVQLGSVDAAVAVGLLVEAAARRLPVIIDGPLAAAAALLAQRVSPTSRHWWLAVDGVEEPVTDQVWDEIAVTRVMTSTAGSGIGGLLAVATVRAAAALLASTTPEQATSEQATPEQATPDQATPDHAGSTTGIA